MSKTAEHFGDSSAALRRNSWEFRVWGLGGRTSHSTRLLPPCPVFWELSHSPEGRRRSRLDSGSTLLAPTCCRDVEACGGNVLALQERVPYTLMAPTGLPESSDGPSCFPGFLIQLSRMQSYSKPQTYKTHLVLQACLRVRALPVC